MKLPIGAYDLPTASLLLWQVAPDWSILAILYLFEARISLLYFDQ